MSLLRSTTARSAEPGGHALAAWGDLLCIMGLAVALWVLGASAGRGIHDGWWLIYGFWAASLRGHCLCAEPTYTNCGHTNV